MTAVASKNRISGNGEAIKSLIDRESLFEMDRLKIAVIGITPLLCASPSSMEYDAGGGARASKSKSLEPADVCRKAAYIDADGHCCFPNVALHSAILSAAELMKLKVGVGRMAPAAASFIHSGMTFDYETVLTKLVSPDTGEPLTEKDYEIDMRRAVNQNTGGAIIAIRPRFDKWAATFDLLIDTKNAQLMGVIDDFFDDILRYAGVSVGLGAFRAYVKPKGRTAKRNAGGPYGKFRARIVD